MFAKIKSFSLSGIDAIPIDVEVDSRKGGIPYFTMVGLPANSVKESKDRVIAALKNCQYAIPPKMYTINLAPADVRKEGVGFDLPIALGLLISLHYIEAKKIENIAVVGELSLDGTLRPIHGILPITIAARESGFHSIIVPEKNAQEAGIVENISVYAMKNLEQCVQFIEGELELQPVTVSVDSLFDEEHQYSLDMFDVKGQYHVKRALEVAAAGSHNILMIGPPGSGKTMLARRIPSILPTMTLSESLTTTKIHSVSGKLLTNQSLVAMRPFRSPHHTISDVALIGGGSYPKPGEVSLAHNGVLFLDELPEFKKNVLEVLRQPLEDGVVTVSRAAQSITFPAQFMLVSSMNPCPCGYYGSDVPGHHCNCSPALIQRYISRLSGPLLDRIDIHVEVPSVKYDQLSQAPTGEHSRDIRARVNTARKRQLERFSHEKNLYSNAQMGAKQLRHYCEIDSTGKELLRVAIERLGLSARAYDRVIKVARTIADLSENDSITTEHLGEAIQYRSLDRKYWV